MRTRLLFAACLLPLASCASFKKVNVFTEPQERAVGEVFASQVEAFFPMLNDPKIDWYLNHRGRQLAQLSDRNDIPYRFSVVDSPELNAFAIPGGHIYINLGMLEATENEAELVAILAHEIGHVVWRHSMKNMSQQTIVGIVGNIALQQYPNQWAALAANLFAATTFLKMSRDYERESDMTAFDVAVRAGYHPQGAADIFTKLLKKYDEEPGKLDKLFMTHPPTRERIERIEAMIATTDLPPNLLRSTPEYEEVHDYTVRTYYSESGRRRWREVLEAKADDEKREKDRLPWDRKEDQRKREKKRKAEAKEKEDKEAAEQKDADSDPAKKSDGET